jgi:hypothetical protein
MPFAGSTTGRKLDPADYQTLLKTLAGTDPTLNPRRIKSLDLSAGDYQDAWGNDLQVVIDFDYDDAIDDALVYGSGRIEVAMLMWSKGPNGVDNSNDTDVSNDDNLTSWKL